MRYLTRCAATLLTGYLLALLGHGSGGALSGEALSQIEGWIRHTLELILDLGSIALCEWVHRRSSNQPSPACRNAQRNIRTAAPRRTGPIPPAPATRHTTERARP